jgi:hypothetical protein
MSSIVGSRHVLRWIFTYNIPDSEKISPELVLYDVPSGNPFRSILPIISSSPLLLKGVLAVAARHHLNQAESLTASSSGLELVSRSSPSLYHALYYKQQALLQMRNDLSAGANGPHRHILIAAMNMLVMAEILESGKDTWRIHLNAVQALAESSDAMSADDELGLRYHLDVSIM